VCDAETDADLQAIAAAWASHPDVLVAGTAAVIGAVTAALLGGGTDRPAPPPVAAPVLVVCGSLHTLARRQVAHVGALGVAVAEPGSFLGTVTDALHAGRPGVVVSPPWRAGAVPAADAQRVAVQLAATAAEVAGAVTVGTLIVIGGDTAAAVLGPEPVTVGGTLAPGIPWARRPDGGPLIVTRAGGFGSRSSLAELVWGRLGT
jgi:4-hydroxythreonine-4-phosphate dehydrogenase